MLDGSFRNELVLQLAIYVPFPHYFRAPFHSHLISNFRSSSFVFHSPCTIFPGPAYALTAPASKVTCNKAGQQMSQEACCFFSLFFFCLSEMHPSRVYPYAELLQSEKKMLTQYLSPRQYILRYLFE